MSDQNGAEISAGGVTDLSELPDMKSQNSHNGEGSFSVSI